MEGSDDAARRLTHIQSELARIDGLLSANEASAEYLTEVRDTLAEELDALLEETPDEEEIELTGWRAQRAIHESFATPEELVRYHDLNKRRFKERDKGRRIAIWEELELLNREFTCREAEKEAMSFADSDKAKILRQEHEHWCETFRTVRLGMNEAGWVDFSLALVDLRHAEISYNVVEEARMIEVRDSFLRRLFLLLGSRRSRTFRIAFASHRDPTGHNEPYLLQLPSYDFRPRLR